MRVRLATRTDISAMWEIERENPASANWSHEHYESLFRTSAAEPPPRYLVLVAEDPTDSENEQVNAPASPIVGYLAAQCVDSDWELHYVVVAKKSRKSGIATLLLNELIHQARAKNGNAIFLEVRQSNQAARALYRKFGFVETGVRKGYYPTPPEDAILYRLTFH
ncbi:MAG: ribosomal protein S18-alanine N-acetyltransferase [Candidatus Sulfotelmatobacter sp.]|jgi:ribosomal-protein-alanine acetyltransferase